MPKVFDATLKALLEMSPRDWPALAGHPARTVELIDADVSTVTAAADKVLRLGRPPESLMHVEFQAGPDAALPRRVHVYNALLEDRHDLPVRSVVILLRPQAELANLTGMYERGLAGEASYLRFGYEVLRVWQLPAEHLLAGGPGILPLAPISAVTPEQVPGVVERMQEQMQPYRGQQAKRIWTATFMLMGLRYERAFTDSVLQGVFKMEESATYQSIIAEGARQGALQYARRAVLNMGRRFLGVPTRQAQATIKALDDLERLDTLLVRVPDVANWEELLDLPPRPPRRRKSSS
jgi:predicted transposase YdaD